MKNLSFITCLLLFCSLMVNAQTQDQMTKWLIDNTSKIDLENSYAKKLSGDLKKIVFSKLELTVTNNFERPAYIGWTTFDKCVIIGDRLILYSNFKDDFIRLVIHDTEIRKKFSQYITRLAYSRFNTIEEDQPIYEKDAVSTAASFIGGPTKWLEFVGNNADLSSALKHDAPPGTYKMEIDFVVLKDGKLKDFINVSKNPKGIDEILLRILLKSKWTPAKLNGVDVSSKTSAKFSVKIDKVDPNSMEVMHAKQQLEFYYSIKGF